MLVLCPIRTLNQIGQIENFYYLSIRSARLFVVIEDIEPSLNTIWKFNICSSKYYRKFPFLQQTN